MSTVAVRKWKEYMVGVFTEDAEIMTPAIVNKNDVLQFFIRILSTPPEDFPKKATNITCFSNALSTWGFEDNREQTPAERIEYIKSFLKDSFIVFHPEQRNDFIIAKDVVLVPKSEEFQYHQSLQLMPYFKGNKEEFEKDIFCGEWLNVEDTVISSQMKHCRHVLFEDEDEQLYIYGPFEYMEVKEGRICLHSTYKLSHLSFKGEWLNRCSQYKNLFFIPEELAEHISMKMKEEGETLKGSYGEQVLNVNVKFSGDDSKESEFLSHFQRVTKSYQFHYELRDLINFHTSLKSSNLVILSGMSGTGKSKLVKMYGEALGLSKQQVLSIKVRPSWIDDSDLIGYLDMVNGIYDSGDSGLVELLLDAQQHPEKMYLVCFEEMNLARIEHYFSQFLSLLESDERVLTLYQPHREILGELGYPSSVKIGQNVLFIGTVNIDESTHAFSDKVLDRTNLMTLNVMPFHHLLDHQEENVEGNLGEITYEWYCQFMYDEKKQSLTRRELNCLWDIHNVLQEVNRNFGIGWRIIHQVNKYLQHLPNQAHLTREKAFDIQIVQRILPKIRGSEELLKETIGDYHFQTSTVERSRLLQVLGSYEDISDFRAAKECVIQKAKEIKINGFTI